MSRAAGEEEPGRLLDYLRRRVAVGGPLTVADFMAEALGHPRHGYYRRRDPFGTAGDFVTAPEISQMFGELVGLWAAVVWQSAGAPDPLHLVELGPGRGTLAADALRATARVPCFADALRLHLVETSPVLRQAQQAALGGIGLSHPPCWHDGIDSLPDGPLLVIANEFFDALPIRQFTRQREGWAETVVGLEGDRLSLGRTPPAPLAALDHRLADTAPGDIVEVCPAAAPIMARIGGLIARHGGAALVIDYGGWQSRGDTFQALQDHRPTDPLAAPGRADLTAHVDFAALAHAAPPARASRMIEQGVLLQRLGIDQRAARLATSLTGAAQESHLAAHRRLTDRAEMGSLFKALAVYPPHRMPPPGFDA